MSDDLKILKERWREAKGTRTFPDIADSTGMSVESLQYAFSSKATNLSWSTVVLISRELCVSIDDACDIRAASPESDLTKADAAHWKARYEAAVRDIEYLRTVILMLGVFFFVVVIWCVTLDLRCADIGFFRGEWNFVAVFSMVCFAIAALMVVLVIIRVYRRHKQRKGEKE